MEFVFEVLLLLNDFDFWFVVVGDGLYFIVLKVMYVECVDWLVVG